MIDDTSHILVIHVINENEYSIVMPHNHGNLRLFYKLDNLPDELKTKIALIKASGKHVTDSFEYEPVGRMSFDEKIYYVRVAKDYPDKLMEMFNDTGSKSKKESERVP